ncbi:threonine aldolase family protein [Xanthomonas translucens]|uniref:threonine aldolase family protein n=1 Tax=Xanthomonas campestris pv. translucens TaxID=343 RepID=UPI000B22DA89
MSVPAATARIGFRNDYSEGAHPRLFAALAAARAEQNGGYGLDRHSARAAQLIRRECACDDADVHLLVGGTQTNLAAIGAFLRPHQAVIAAACGHIATHETGAIEATGHKVLTVDAADGRLSPERIAPLLAEHGNEHMVQPRLLYVSNTTELGTIYRKRELQALRAFCDAHGLWLFLDGARIGSALTAEGNDLSLADIAALTDAFYIGGTKNGALLGEALVIVNPALQADFRYLLKQRGALLAKGMVLGAQFASDSPTNQLFVTLPADAVEALAQRYDFERWQLLADGRSVIRFVTSWATQAAAVDALCRDFAALSYPGAQRAAG